jgi:radical SAM superfamily enzyme YgiQ (UPF0313 family)
MKILLFYPYLKENPVGCNPPLGLMYLSASLIKHGYDTELVDIDAFDGNLKSAFNKIINSKPDLIGLPLYSLFLREAYYIVHLIKTVLPQSLILLGGPHASVLAEDVLNNLPECDFILRGEAEGSIIGLMQALEGGKDLGEVGGLSFRQGGRIIHNQDRGEINNLDQIEFPARDLLNEAYKKGVYWRIEHKGVTDILISSRGCPYQCGFCYKTYTNFRERSADNIIRELIILKSRGVKAVHFVDETFTLNRKRCIDIFELLKKEKLGLELKLRTRADLVDRELLVLMKESGVKSIVYGLESGSQKILDAMSKGLDVKRNLEIVRLTKKTGLHVLLDMMIGYPPEDRATINETIGFLRQASPDAINLSILVPFPETKIYTCAKEKGNLVGDWGFHDNLPWVRLPWTKTYKDLEREYLRVERNFWLNPRIIIKNFVRYILSNVSFNNFKRAENFLLKMTFASGSKRYNIDIENKLGGSDNGF